VLCGLLFCATALSFLDRQVLSVLAPTLIAEFDMTNTTYSRVVTAFVASYTVMFAVGGRIMDALGTRVGLALAVGLWSLASAAHALATGPWSLGAARFVLGVGEGACFPGATKGAIEWMPRDRRALAVGVANGGSAFGAVLAPPLTAWWASTLGWRGAFVVTAVLGLAWLAAWAVATRGLPSTRDTRATGDSVRFRDLLARPEVRRLVAARFCFDPVFYLYMFWIPQYLARERGMSLAQIGALTWMPFLAVGVSTIVGGRVSDLLVERGWPPRRARLTWMLAAALFTPASWFVVVAGGPGAAIALMSVLMFAHGFWIANFITLITDIVDARAVATAVGLTGMAGGIAGMLSNLATGPVVDAFGFAPVFLAASVVYPIAWLIIASHRPAAVSGPEGVHP
jgi:ACS family hexuronate transporter-like MFS transporter